MIKLFLSYTHKDKEYLENFRKHLATLKEKKVVSEWYDGMISVGDEISDSISAKMKESNVILFFFSSDFLSSSSCQKEIDKAIALNKKNDIRLVPVVVRPCDWEKSKLGEKDLMACPKDGNPVSSYPNQDDAWMEVIKEIWKLLPLIKKRKELTPEFEKFLRSTGDLLSTPNKDVCLQDTYVHPNLIHRVTGDEDDHKTFPYKPADHVLGVNVIKPDSMILVLGNEMSGKTALGKMLYTEYQDSPYIPVLIRGNDVSNDNLSQIEKTAFKKQYESLTPASISNSNKIIIFDDFADDDMKERDIYSLVTRIKEAEYHAVVLVASSMHGMFSHSSWNQHVIENDIAVYEIEKAGHNQRYNIIEKWLCATANLEEGEELEKQADRQRKDIDLLFFENLLPSYPPFIIMALGNLLAVTARDEKMSSYGHCYNVIIIRHLLGAGVPIGPDVGAYLRLLTNLAYYMYEHGQGGKEIGAGKISTFFEKQEKKFFDDDQHKVMERLISSKLLNRDMYGVIKMEEYVFYYFVGKYLAEHFEEELVKEEIKQVFSLAHKKRYGNVLLFLVHHMPRHGYVLDLLNRGFNNLFSGIEEAKLTSEETKPLHQFMENLVKPVISAETSETEIKKSREMKIRDSEQRGEEDIKRSHHAEDTDNVAVIDLSRAFRMMTIGGAILKNEIGTMDKPSLAKLTVSIRGASFRIIGFFLKSLVELQEWLDKEYLDLYLKKNMSNWEQLTSTQQSEKKSQFMGFVALGFTCEMIERCSESIGSAKLTTLVGSNRDEENDIPAYELLNLAVNMSCENILDIENIKSMLKKHKGNIFVIQTLRFIVATHCHLHRIDGRDRQRLAGILELDIKHQETEQYYLMKKGGE